VNRQTILWTLTLFFGASVAFGLIRSATKDSPVGVSLGLQFLALAVIVGAIVVVQRRQKP
jgi:hypothetical protein